MANLVILTMSEDEYRELYPILKPLNINTKILPDDSELSDHPQYQEVKKAYKKAREIKEKIAFELLTNNTKKL